MEEAPGAVSGPLPAEPGAWERVEGVIRIDEPRLGTAISARDVLVLVVCGGLLLTGGLWFGQMFISILGGTGLIAGLVVAIVTSLGNSGLRGRAAGLVARTLPDSWEHLALRAWGRARLKSTWTWRGDPRRGVHEEEWFGRVPEPPDARPRPTVILADVRPVFVPGGEELAETVEVGPIRRLTPEARRKRMWQLFWLAVAAIAMGSPLLLGVASPRFWTAWFAVQAMVVVYRLGWAPILIDSAIASMGTLEVLKWGTRKMFVAHEAVLVVEPAGGLTKAEVAKGKGQVRVHAIAKDGTLASLVFDGIQDPGLSDLLGRWLQAQPETDRTEELEGDAPAAGEAEPQRSG